MDRLTWARKQKRKAGASRPFSLLFPVTGEVTAGSMPVLNQNACANNAPTLRGYQQISSAKPKTGLTKVKHSGFFLLRIIEKVARPCTT